MKEKILNILQKYYGYKSFRKGQENIITSILQGEDVLAIMPTWWWKITMLSNTSALFGWNDNSNITINISYERSSRFTSDYGNKRLLYKQFSFIRRL